MYGIEHWDENKLRKDANSRERLPTIGCRIARNTKKRQLCPLSNRSELPRLLISFPFRGIIMAFPSILCVGEDPELLKTRAMLLQRLNAEVKWTTSIREALVYLSNENFDLIVLCHSLKESNAAAISDAIRKRQPPPIVLSISKSFGFKDERAQIVCDAIVDAHPASLTDCARALLLRRSESAKSPRSELWFGDTRKFAGHH